MNLSLLMGNLCSLLGMAADSLSSAQKTTKGMLWMQSLGQLIYGIGTFLLGGYSGVVQNVVSILRNLVAIWNLANPVLEWLLAGLGVVFGLAFNNLGFIGILPVIGNLQYTLAIFRCRNNERLLKISFAATIAMYAIFNLAILNLVGVACNLVVLATTAFVLIKDKKTAK